MYLYLEEVSFLKNYLSIIYEIGYSLMDFFWVNIMGGPEIRFESQTSRLEHYCWDHLLRSLCSLKHQEFDSC